MTAARTARAGVIAGLLALLAAAILLSLAVGARSIAPGTVWHELLAPTGGREGEIVRELRVPRTLLGIEIGIALAIAGALMQALTRNPLADPGLLGVNAGAATAVVLGLVLGAGAGLSTSIWLGFAGAAAAMVLVHALGARGRGSTPVRLALAGTAISATLMSLVAAMVLLDPAALDAFRSWEVGALSGRDPEAAGTILPFVLGGGALALLLARSLDALALGDDAGRALGANVARTRAGTVAAVALLSGAATAAAGPIAFVGLTVPHMARALMGPDHRWVMPCAALLGAALLLLADVAGRVLDRPGEVQVGLVVAVLGAPVFIALVRSRRIAAL